MRIDAHQHFWKYNARRDSWITNNMHVLQRDFLPHHLEPLLQQQGFDGCVAVQADQSEKETDYLLQLADESPFIKGVVGWVDLQSSEIEERLHFFFAVQKTKRLPAYCAGGGGRTVYAAAGLYAWYFIIAGI